MAIASSDIDIRKLVAFTATPETPQVIPAIGANLDDGDVKVYGVSSENVSTLISSDWWSFNEGRDELTLQYTASYANVLVLVETVIEQPLDYNRDTSFLPAVLEKQLDRLALSTAWIKDRLNNVLSFNQTDGVIPSGDLGTAVDRALKFIGFDSNGDIAMTSVSLTLTEDLSALTREVDNIIIADGVDWIVMSKAQFLSQYSLVVGADLQAWSAQLDDLATVAPTDTNVMVGNGGVFVSRTPAEFKVIYNLVPGTDVQAYNSNLTGIDQALDTTADPTFNTVQVADVTGTLTGLGIPVNALPSTTLVNTATYNILATDRHILVDDDAVGGAVTLNLPATATVGDGWVVSIKKLGSTGDVTIVPDGVETVENLASRVVQHKLDATHIVADPANTNFQVMFPIQSSGWAHYVDSGANNITTSGTARQAIAIDGGNGTTGTTIETYLPAGSSSFWDAVTNKLTPDKLGDCYDIRLDFVASPSASTESILVELDIGGGIGAILSRSISFSETGAQSVSMAFPIYALNTFKTNGGTFYITPSANFDFTDFAVFIKRDFSPL